MNRKRNTQSVKQNVAKKIIDHMTSCESLTELKRKLHESHIQTYERQGMLTGIIFNNRKYRLKKTLGIDLKLLRELTLEEKRLLDLKTQQRKKQGRQR